MKRDYWPTEEWRAATPEAMGMNAELLTEADRVIRAKFKTVNSF